MWSRQWIQSSRTLRSMNKSAFTTYVTLSYPNLKIEKQKQGYLQDLFQKGQSICLCFLWHSVFMEQCLVSNSYPRSLQAFSRSQGSMINRILNELPSYLFLPPRIMISVHKVNISEKYQILHVVDSNFRTGSLQKILLNEFSLLILYILIVSKLYTECQKWGKINDHEIFGNLTSHSLI